MAATAEEGTARKLVTRNCGEPSSKASNTGDSRKDGVSLAPLCLESRTMERHRMQVSRFWLLDGELMVGLSVGIIWRWDRDAWIHVEPVAEIEDDQAEGVFPAELGLVLTPDEIAEAWVAIDAEAAERAQSRRRYFEARDHCFS